MLQELTIRADKRSQPLASLQFLSFIAFGCAAANVLLLLVVGHYDVRVGPLHFVAHEIFKPLQLLAAAFWIALALRTSWRNRSLPGESSERLSSRSLWLLAMLILLVHGPFIGINFANPFWAHLESSAGITSWAAAGKLFTMPQSDGFYRPLTFLSLFGDYWLFGPHWAAYHIQSLLLHIANTILLCYLARDLGLGVRAAYAGALLFGVAPLTFEAVLWPAARFDLWAAFFLLLALRTSMRILKSDRFSIVPHFIAAALYILALLNKESAYCLPLLLLFLAATHRLWGIERIERRNVLGLLAALGAVTAAMLAFRFSLYHSLGGYAAPAGQSEHAHLGFKTLESLFTRVLAVAPFTANLSTGIFLSLGLGLLLFVLAFAAILIGKAAPSSVEWALLALALTTALPTLNIIGWVGANAQQSRYLYLPGAWLMLLIARLIYRTNWPQPLLVSMLAANCLITYSDLSVYHDMFHRTRWLAGQIAGEKHIVIRDLPAEPNGIFFFRDELKRQILARSPETAIDFEEETLGQRPVVYYRWDAATRTLKLIQPPHRAGA